MGAQHWLGADDGPSHGVEAAQTRALEHPTRCRWHTLARCQSEIEKMLKDMEGPLSGGRKDLEASIASSGTAPCKLELELGVHRVRRKRFDGGPAQLRCSSYSPCLTLMCYSRVWLLPMRLCSVD